MPRPIRHRSHTDSPAQRAFETLVDREFLQARLARLGGQGAALLKLEVSGEPPDVATLALRQGVAREDLPALLQKVMPGDLVIERAESWRRVEPGHFSGSVDATVVGAPGTIAGTLELREVGGGSDLSLDGSAHVPIPLIGGKVEAVIAEQVERLIDRETRFLWEWLAR